MTTYESHERLLAALSRAVQRDHSLRRRRRQIGLVALAMLVLCGGAVAASKAPWWQSAAAPVNPEVVDRQLAPAVEQGFPPSADRSRARTVAEWKGATLVAAPVGDTGGYCMIPALPDSPDIGFSCEYQADDEVRAYARPGANARWIMWGRFLAPEAATIDLGTAIGAQLQVTLQPGGFFIADLPQSRWAALDDGAGRARLLDSSGGTIESVCLNFGPSPRSTSAGQTQTPSPLTSVEKCTYQAPIPLSPELERARKLVETTLRHDFALFAAGTHIALYEAPDAGSMATCLLVERIPLPAGKQPQGGMACGEMDRQTTPRRPLVASYSWAGSTGTTALVTGQVDPSADVSDVAVDVGEGREVALAFANDHFIGEVEMTKGKTLREADVIAYDAHGVVVARVRLR